MPSSQSDTHYAPEDDVPDDWRPFDQRKWSREELLAEIDALNAEVAKWVGIATQRRGAIDLARRLAEGAREAQDTGDSRTLNDALAEYDRLTATGGQ